MQVEQFPRAPTFVDILMHVKVKKTYYISAGLAGRHVVCFGDFSADVFLEIQNVDVVQYCI